MSNEAIQKVEIPLDIEHTLSDDAELEEVRATLKELVMEAAVEPEGPEDFVEMKYVGCEVRTEGQQKDWVWVTPKGQFSYGTGPLSEANQEAYEGRDAEGNLKAPTPTQLPSMQLEVNEGKLVQPNDADANIIAILEAVNASPQLAELLRD